MEEYSRTFHVERIASEIAEKCLDIKWRNLSSSWWRQGPYTMIRDFNVKNFHQLLKRVTTRISREMNGAHYERIRFDEAIIFDGGNHVLMVLKADGQHLKAVIV